MNGQGSSKTNGGYFNPLEDILRTGDVLAANTFTGKLRALGKRQNVLNVLRGGYSAPARPTMPPPQVTQPHRYQPEALSAWTGLTFPDRDDIPRAIIALVWRAARAVVVTCLHAVRAGLRWLNKDRQTPKYLRPTYVLGYGLLFAAYWSGYITFRVVGDSPLPVEMPTPDVIARANPPETKQIPKTQPPTLPFPVRSEDLTRLHEFHAGHQTFSNDADALKALEEITHPIRSATDLRDALDTAAFSARALSFYAGKFPLPDDTPQRALAALKPTSLDMIRWIVVNTNTEGTASFMQDGGGSNVTVTYAPKNGACRSYTTTIAYKLFKQSIPSRACRDGLEWKQAPIAPQRQEHQRDR